MQENEMEAFYSNFMEKPYYDESEKKWIIKRFDMMDGYTPLYEYHKFDDYDKAIETWKCWNPKERSAEDLKLMWYNNCFQHKGKHKK